MNIHEVAKSGKPFRNPSMIGAWMIIDEMHLVHCDNINDFKDMDGIRHYRINLAATMPQDLYWMTVEDLLRDDWEIIEI